jgi:hypothetical protein
MIPITTQSSNARFSDPLSRSPATAASAIPLHFESKGRKNPHKKE